MIKLIIYLFVLFSILTVIIYSRYYYLKPQSAEEVTITKCIPHQCTGVTSDGKELEIRVPGNIGAKVGDTLTVWESYTASRYDLEQTDNKIAVILSIMGGMFLLFLVTLVYIVRLRKQK